MIEIARRCAFMAPSRDPILPTFALDEDMTVGEALGVNGSLI